MQVIKSLAVVALLFAGCATAPSSTADKQNLRQSANATLSEMIARNPKIQGVIGQAQAYAVFPSIGKGGVIVGGAFGRGVLYEGGVPTGFVSLQQASIGAQLGGQTFAELLVLRSPRDVESVKDGTFKANADLGVVFLNAGAAGQAPFDPSASVFVMPHGGLMVDVSINGQKLSYSSFRT
jgi:lipid-binding SYLF domain-containing protein